jgi:MFS family permease
MLTHISNAYLTPMKTFKRSARLFLLMIVIYGIIYSIWALFFNFYMLEAGYTREFLGLVNAMPFASALVLGLPLGWVSDRIGRKPALIIGLVVSGIAMALQVTVTAPGLILAMAFLDGVAYNLFIISQAPLMVKLSNAENRTLLFSLNFAMSTLSGAVGSLFAGQLPQAFGTLLHVAPRSASAYQAVLLASIALGTTSLIPLLMMREPTSGAATQPEEKHGEAGEWGVLRLALKLGIPQLITGFGAAILIPYGNVFFLDKFAISDSLLGVLFSLSSLLIGIGSIVGPRLAIRLNGKINAIVLTQYSSLIFLVLMGFSPLLWLSVVGFLVRGVLMNMSAPLYSAFAMEQVPERDQGQVNSIQNIAWEVGWAIGPYISGIVQEHYGFAPLFLATTVLYCTSTTLTWVLFGKAEKRFPAPIAESA